MRPSSSPSEPGLFDEVLARGPVRYAVGDRALLAAMLRAEAALALAAAELGAIPPRAAQEIAAACQRLDPDIAALGRAAATHGSPVLALVEALRAAVSAEHATYVHRGATTQDVVDTAVMLVAQEATGLVLGDLDAAADLAAGLARTHRDTPMIGRTLLQQAVPITFGLKAAGWLGGLDAAAGRLRAVPFAAQLGGAAGTLAGLPGAGPAVARRYAQILHLAAPALPWHGDRSRIADLATALGVAAGAAGKVARDVTLLAQTEVAEVAEATPAGSTAMAHKRNPVAAIGVLAAAKQAPGLVGTLLAGMIGEHERAAGAWHAEGKPLRDLLIAAGSAASWLRACLDGLRVDPAAMRTALDRAGWPLEAGADPARPLGSAADLVDAALAEHDRSRGESS